MPEGSPLYSVAIAVAVFVASTAIDYAHARMLRAVADGDDHRAAAWSVLQWGAACVGFVVAARVSLWFLPFEAAGLYLGMRLGLHRARAPRARLPRARAQVKPRTEQ